MQQQRKVEACCSCYGAGSGSPFSLVLLHTPGIAFYTPANNISWAADYTQAQEQSVQDGKPVILFFTATWCVPCRIMKRTVWADEQVAAIVNKSYIPMMVYADDPDMAALFSRFQVGATPTTILLNAQGDERERIYGAISKADFINLLATIESER